MLVREVVGTNFVVQWTDVGDPRAKKFEEPDDGTNVQLTDVNDKQIISACSLEKLMQKLTLESYPCTYLQGD